TTRRHRRALSLIPSNSQRVRRIDAICKKHDVPMIEAALNFPLYHPAVISVIPGGQSISEVKANRAMLGRELPSALWAELKAAGLMRPDAPTLKNHASNTKG
ncbi:MAG TPA: aldo/keto reductase, partial [Phyllobacterium sp.]|nr:aldo/keto reductase [Phyllobacterium sp.]